MGGWDVCQKAGIGGGASPGLDGKYLGMSNSDIER